MIAVVVLGINFPLIHYYLFRSQMATVTQVPFLDDFANPDTIGKNYWSNGGQWRVVGGELFSPGVKNNPLWLRASLPRDVAVEFDARSMSEAGDIKVEIFGDGLDHATGYVLVHGGWNNSLSVIARLDEHGTPLAALLGQARATSTTSLVESGLYHQDTRVRVEANPYPVVPGRTYHWRVERRGGKLSWSIDGAPFMSFDDPLPFAGKGHDRFGFSSWDSDLYFDNLRVTPL